MQSSEDAHNVRSSCNLDDNDSSIVCHAPPSILTAMQLDAVSCAINQRMHENACMRTIAERQERREKLAGNARPAIRDAYIHLYMREKKSNCF